MPTFCYQPLQEVVLEEQDIHAHHNGYQSKHVKRDGGVSSHRFIVRIRDSPEMGGVVRCLAEGRPDAPAFRPDAVVHNPELDELQIECQRWQLQGVPLPRYDAGAMAVQRLRRSSHAWRVAGTLPGPDRMECPAPRS